MNVGREMLRTVASARVRGLRTTVVLALGLLYLCNGVVLFGSVSALVGSGPTMWC